ncbi:MAG: hypothetical protein HRU19_11720 [Pseudobacteriovorax sp.]|nr:hypothetical protein [Pseudobacteriovorax sp.]
MNLTLRFAFTLVLFLLARSYFIFDSSLTFKGWDSDSAIIGLMATDLYQNGNFPYYYWGQEYLGPLTSWVSVPIQHVFDFIGTSVSIEKKPYLVHPLTLSIASSLVFFTGFFAISEIIRKSYSPFAAYMFLLLACASGSFLAKLSFRPLGHEALYLCIGMLATSTYYLQKQPINRVYQVWFGATIALVLWIHHGAMLLLAAIAVDYGVKHHHKVLKNLLYAAKATFTGGLTPFYAPKNAALIGLYFLLGLAVMRITGGFMLDFLRLDVDTSIFGIPVRAGNGSKLIKATLIPVVLVLVTMFLLRHGIDLRPLPSLVKKYSATLLGFVAIYVTKPIAESLGFFAKSYTFTPRIAKYDDFLRLDTFILDYLTGFIFPNIDVPISLTLICILLASFGYTVYLTVRANAPKVIRWGCYMGLINTLIILTTGLFIPRYGLLFQLSLFMSLAYIVVLLITDERYKKTTISLRTMASFSIAAALVIGLAKDQLGLKAQMQREIPISKELESFATGKCQVYYADYWDAYRIEFLTAGRVKFVPWKSQDRRPRLSAQRQASNLTPCWYTKGKISTKGPTM